MDSGAIAWRKVYSDGAYPWRLMPVPDVCLEDAEVRNWYWIEYAYPPQHYAIQAKERVRQKWCLCLHPAWPDPLELQAGTMQEAVREILPNYRPGVMLVRTLVGGRMEIQGDQLAALVAAEGAK